MRRAWAIYAASMLPLAVTLAVHGPRALAFDGHPLQRWQSALFLALGFAVFRMAELPVLERFAFAAAASWLAVDEWLMVHECVKWKGWLPLAGGDPLVLVYGVGSIAVLARILARSSQTRQALPHAAVACAAALTAMVADTTPIASSDRLAATVVEELAELLALSGAIAAVLAATGRPGRALHAALWVALQAAWMFAAVWLARPWLCPPRLLQIP